MKEDVLTDDGEAWEKETAPLPLDEVGRLVALLTSSGVGEIRVKQGETEITVRAKPEPPPAAPATAAAAAITPRLDDDAGLVEPGVAPAAELDGLHAVRSPVVGTFYRAPAPEAEPFVEVGSRVAEGQTLCIVEAMKLMNEIPSDVTGEVVEVLAENTGGVEYDQPLFKIRTESSG